MENYEQIQRWPWLGRGQQVRGREPFTMWTPQDSGESGADRPHRGRGRGHGDGARGGAGRRGGPFPRAGFGGGFGGGFGPGGDLGRGRGRGGRGRRGDVRAAILLLLSESPMHGYELIQQIIAKSEGAWKPSPGSIYPALSQLEDEGLVLIDKIGGRKTARLTDDGVTYVAEHRADLGSPWDDVRGSVGGDAIDLRGLIGLLMGAAGQVAAVGTPEQVEAAGGVIDDARRKLYRILAEDESGDSGAGAASDADPRSDA